MFLQTRREVPRLDDQNISKFMVRQARNIFDYLQFHRTLFSDPLDTDPISPRNRTLAALELIFNILFSVESFIKIVAMGSSMYFADGWNRLDFFVVVIGWLPSILDSILQGSNANGMDINLSAIRAIRALKILRTANSIDGMKQIVSGILSAIPNLANVMYLTVFVFAVFGLLFVKFYGGKLRQIAF